MQPGGSNWMPRSVWTVVSNNNIHRSFHWQFFADQTQNKRKTAVNNMIVSFLWPAHTGCPWSLLLCGRWPEASQLTDSVTRRKLLRSNWNWRESYRMRTQRFTSLFLSEWMKQKNISYMFLSRLFLTVLNELKVRLWMWIHTECRRDKNLYGNNL
jgi:hypothetical protein